jgi:uroporphyrinogen-III synthase
MSEPDVTKYEPKAQKLNVILLKSNENSDNESNKQSGIEDRYVEFLKGSNCSILFNLVEQINVLNFEYCNVDLIYESLSKHILDNQVSNASTYKCLIVTSRQTVETIERAFENKQINLKSHSNNVHREQLIVYCVGESTATRFNQLIEKLKAITGNERIQERFEIKTPTLDQRSNNQEQNKHKQNSKELSKLIIDDYLANRSLGQVKEYTKYALYPCSSIRRDDLPTELNMANISFDEIIAYKTSKCPTAMEKLKDLFKLLRENTSTESASTCLVFFSPSGVDSLFEDDAIQLLFNSCLNIVFISVGPTTSSRLRKAVMNHKATMTVPIYELSEPSPQALLKTLNDTFTS